jgi:hypothetical protein
MIELLFEDTINVSYIIINKVWQEVFCGKRNGDLSTGKCISWASEMRFLP